MTKDTSLPPRPTPLQPRQRALIIGASSGIGAALARLLAAEGYTLALVARRAERLADLRAEINTAAGETRALIYPHDVTHVEEAPALFRRILADLGGLDLCIYVAGLLIPVERDEFTFEKDAAMTAVNYLGALAWLNPAAAVFQGTGQGTIVGIGSVAGDRGRVGAPAYNASKAALHTYLEALRNRLSRRGVHVLTVKPGFVRTDMLQYSPRTFWVISPEQAASAIYRAIRRRKQVVYVPARWAWLMWVIRHIPSFIFRRLTF